MPVRRYVLLDRDGTIIQEKNYLASAEDVELIPGAAAGLRALREAGYGLIVITNQSGIARGYFNEQTLSEIHASLEAKLGAEGVQLDAILYCPHAPEDNCDCRKPRTGLMERAAKMFGFNPKDAVVIGDKACDIELGKRCGAYTILVRSGYGREHEERGVEADHVCDDLPAAAARAIQL